MADLSTEQLEAMFKKVLEPVTVALDSLQLGLDSVKRTVNAIETLPVPYGRPKAYVSATEFQSVSNPVRVRQGQNG